MNVWMDRINKIKPYTVMLVVPLFFTLLFAGAMSPVINHDIPVMLYDMDNSPESQTVREQLEKYPYFKLYEGAYSLDEVEDEFLYGNIVGAVIIPQGFGADIKAKQGGELLVMQDACNFMNMSGVMTGLSNVSGTLNAAIRIQLLEAGGMTPAAATQNVTTLSVVDRGLYNPTYGYIYFLFPVLLAIFVQQTYLAAASPYLIEQKKLLAMAPADSSAIGRIARQLLLFVLCGMACQFGCMLILQKGFHYPFLGSPWLILLALVPFMLAMTGMVLAITALFDDEVHCTQFNMFLTIPATLSCGYAWPEYMMPTAFKAIITRIWPLYYYANPLHDIAMKNADFAQVAPYVKGCLLFAAFWLPFGMLAYAHKIKRLRQHS